jgi:hypothetical protein
VIAATAVASLGVFVFALVLSGVIGVAGGVLTTTQDAVATMRDRSLDDAAREKAIQRASLRLLSDVGSILVRGALSVAVSLVPVWLADATGLATFEAVFGFLSRWDVVVIASAVMIAGYVIQSRLWPSG